MPKGYVTLGKYNRDRRTDREALKISNRIEDELIKENTNYAATVETLKEELQGAKDQIEELDDDIQGYREERVSLEASLDKVKKNYRFACEQKDLYENENNLLRHIQRLCEEHHS